MVQESMTLCSLPVVGCKHFYPWNEDMILCFRLQVGLSASGCRRTWCLAGRGRGAPQLLSCSMQHTFRATMGAYVAAASASCIRGRLKCYDLASARCCCSTTYIGVPDADSQRGWALALQLDFLAATGPSYRFTPATLLSHTATATHISASRLIACRRDCCRALLEGAGHSLGWKLRRRRALSDRKSPPTLLHR